MAKQLEVSLYREAPSKEAYLDTTTLKQRLQQIAMEVSRKTRDRSNNLSSSGRGSYSHQPQQPQAAQSQQHQVPQQLQQQAYGNQSSSMMRNDMGGSTSPYMTSSKNTNVGQMVNMDDINPMAQGGNGYSLSGLSDRGQRPQPSSSGGIPTNGNNRNNEEWKMRIKHKQQRLLLLHHSAKCPHESGCGVTQHCAEMKRLWRHMEGCKDNNCRISHCFSSRAILSHYRKCRDTNCPACVPVRDTVRKSRSTQSRSQGISTGPMMDRLRGNTTPSQGQGHLMPSDPLGTSGGGSYSAPPPPGVRNSFSNGRVPSSHAGMPPPVSQSSHNSQYSVHPTVQQTTLPTQQQHPTLNHSPRITAVQSAPPQSTFRQENTIPDARSSTSRNSRDVPLSSDKQTGDGTSRSEAELQKQKIRHKQQRLLLLRHASRCQHTVNCPTTPHCASMKELWDHIAHCRNQQCTFQHCLSSRYVLSHYRRCREPSCPACAPVRETIRSSSKQQGRTSFDNMSSTSDPFGPTSATPPPSDSLPPVQASNANIYSVPQLPSPKIEVESPNSPTEREAKRIKTYSSPTLEELAPILPDSNPLVVDQDPDPALSSAIEPPVEEVETPEPMAIPSALPSAVPSSTAIKDPVNEEVRPTCDHSLLNSFTVKQLETHLASLDRRTQLPAAKLKSKCMEVLKGLQSHQHAWVFNNPVDPVELGLPDYFDVIKKPMDLGTVQKKIENGIYHSIDEFAGEVNMTFDNATTYNEDGSVVYNMAKELKSKFSLDLKKLYDQLEAEDQQRRENEKACTLCGCEKLLFEPPVYFCNGMNCQSQRIRRNSHFYIGGNNQYFWCVSCYNELDEKRPIELVDVTISKTDLKKKKNDEVHEESWVQCDSCESWVHQICGLFNTRQNKEHHSQYCCPKCLLSKRKTTEITPSARPPSAADLPRTTLSEWLEQNIAKKVETKKRELAAEKAQSEVSSYVLLIFLLNIVFNLSFRFAPKNITLDEALNHVEAGGPIYIRQVTSMERKLEVRELMRARYAHKNYPEEFPFRCKCIVVFQELDGVDVILFALYVYEHGADNPPPNQRVVYISYLDSVHFMRPRIMRTFVYHEILIAYLDYARRRGFSTAHIWACPPLKGDDYIFFAKPEDQKTPRDGRLRQWYIDMLLECQKRNIVGKVTNLYDLYFANENLDATVVPYLEGDYFPGEAENIIKMLLEGGGKKGGGGGKKKKSKATNKSKGNTGTRSTGVDEEALIASGILDGAKTLKDLDRDQVMVKLGETIQPMKDSFIVAFLNWTGAKEEDLVVPKEIEKARLEYSSSLKEDNDLAGSKRDPSGTLRDVALAKLDRNGKEIKVIDDDAEDLDCEFLNNRQAFLNLCRGNHYQFDEVRRAKHTSIMVLWHLHNRDAPKFVQQCSVCSREILSGKRYHCNTCTEFDLCQTCYDDPNSNRGSCTHELVPIAVEPDASKERSCLTEAERQQRQRNLMIHIQLIEHAARCTLKVCPSRNCPRMKSFLRHASTCTIKVQGGCKICKRIWTLLRIHAQKCKDSGCPIPQCLAIKEKMRQLQKQQQAMDDRRRIEMNRHMRVGSSAIGQ
jgi:E1A/CREB-binding protein